MGRITRNSIALTVEKGAHLLFGMGLMVGVARLLGEGELGSYAYAISLTALFVPILDMGLNNRVIVAVASGGTEASEAASEAVALKLALAPAALVAMGVVAWFSDKPAEVLVVVLLVGGSTVAMSLGDAVNALFKGLQKPVYSALLVGGLNGLLFGTGIGAMAAGLGLAGVGACYFLCRIGYLGAGLGLAGRVAPDLRPSFRPGIRWNLVANGLRYLPAPYFLGNLLNLNFITTDWAVDEAASGQFAIAYRFAVAMFVLVSASLEAILPMLTHRFGQAQDLRRTLVRASGVFLGITLLGVGIVQVAAYPATVWVFGPDYAPAVKAIRLLVWTVPPFALCGLAHTALLAMNREGAALAMLALVVTGTGLGAAVIPFWGASGTALAPAVTGCLFAGFLWRMVWKEVRKVRGETKP